MYSPSHRQSGAPIINIQSTIRTASDLFKNISLAVLLYIYIYIHIHILYDIQKVVGQKR